MGIFCHALFERLLFLALLRGFGVGGSSEMWSFRLWKNILRSLITSTRGQKVIMSCRVTQGQARNLTANFETPLVVVIRLFMLK